MLMDRIGIRKRVTLVYKNAAHFFGEARISNLPLACNICLQETAEVCLFLLFRRMIWEVFNLCDL